MSAPAGDEPSRAAVSRRRSPPSASGSGSSRLLFVLAGVGWWWTADQMRGMDEGPWSALGGLGWFLGVWLVMMAAMMFPSVAPTVALYSRMTRQRSPRSPLLFAAGYLVTWGAAGLVAFTLAVVGARAVGDVLSWDRQADGSRAPRSSSRRSTS